MGTWASRVSCLGPRVADRERLGDKFPKAPCRKLFVNLGAGVRYHLWTFGPNVGMIYKTWGPNVL